MLATKNIATVEYSRNRIIAFACVDAITDYLHKLELSTIIAGVQSATSRRASIIFHVVCGVLWATGCQPNTKSAML